MKHLGLFEGIGGFSLAARWMGWETKAWCEINPFCQRVLRYHFPEAEGFEDITKTDFTKYANKIDVLTGGFPCQPFSIAGERKGKEDERHLWPEMLRAIREVQPRWVVGENVLGLVNWNGGMVFHEVQTDLEAAGYEVWPYVLPACGVNAPQQRYRVWFIAYSNSNRLQRWKNGRNGESREWESNSKIEFARCNKRNYWSENWSGINSITECFDNGLPKKLDGVTIPKWYEQSLMSYGNAIVPQVALQIFKAIEKYESLTLSNVLK